MNTSTTAAPMEEITPPGVILGVIILLALAVVLLLISSAELLVSCRTREGETNATFGREAGETKDLNAQELEVELEAIAQEDWQHRLKGKQIV